MQKNIDQQFQEAIGQLDSSPAGLARNPEANWTQIEGMLNGDRQKRRAAWFWIAAAASVAILVTLGWFLIPDRPEDQREPMAMVIVPGEDSIPIKQHEPSPAIALADSTAFAANNQELQQQKLVSQKDMLNVVAYGGTVVNGGTAVVNGSTSHATGTEQIAMGSTIILQTQASNNAYTYNWTPGTATATSTPNPSDVTFYSIAPSSRAGQMSEPTTKPTPGFLWDFGNGDLAEKNYTMAGNYTVSVTDANGCVNGKKIADNKQTLALGLKGKSKVNGQQGYLTLDSVKMGIADPYGGESYAETVENAYYMTIQDPLSTFSIDVDRASYTNHRRFIESGQLPPKYSVRAEEFINYFNYKYPQPRGGEPFSILPEVTTCPWNPKHQIVRIALKGREVATENIPPSNIVFLLDVSGSMTDADKLPLLKQAMGMLTEKLREQDKVSIVVYAGAAGLVLPPTSGSNKQAIMAALNRLEAGGSTAGGQGIELAYATAKQNFMKGGNNRVILATDGDFNVGTSDETGLEKLIVQKREEGVFLSVLGFGEGNLQDSKMELLADKGNGNYNYIDSDREANKVLVSEFGGTLYTIAKDVKIQVEFNPAKVQCYRLVGYENRKLRNEDFANDKIDAGELGAGHTVTALYEVVPAEGGWSSQSSSLKYQQQVLSDAAAGKELLTVKLRYKDPDGSVSKLLEETLLDDGRNIAETSEDFRWAVAVAEYALILRQSDYKGLASYDQVLSLARSAMGPDKEGLRREFVDLVTKAAATTQTARKN
jgi:Ca-activated chloride channel family protein